MARAKDRYKNKQKKTRRPISVQMQGRLREGFFLLTVAMAAFLFISLASYHANDPSWSSTGVGSHVANWGGRVGAWLADIFLFSFGVIAYIFPVLMTLAGWINLHEEHLPEAKSFEWIFKLLGWILVILSSCSLVSFYLYHGPYLPAETGGIIGDVFGHWMSSLFNQIGSTILFLALLFCGITLITGFSWLAMLRFLFDSSKSLSQWMLEQAARLKDLPQLLKIKKQDAPAKPSIDRKEPSLLKDKVVPIISKISSPVKPKPALPVVAKPVSKKPATSMASKVKLKEGMLPPFNLLDPYSGQNEKAFNDISLEALSELVEQRLADFGVDVKVTAVLPGPVITRFELDLAPGIKVSKIVGLSKDIARSLSTISVRVVEVIPGKSVIGLEIPNENRDLVSLRDVFESERYEQSRSPVSLVLGKDISGQPVVVDLAKMPHLLVAGTTGSGKSVSLNAMLVSMLFKATPDQLRLILIDPKMLELSVYDGIPHLLTPVITDMKEATNSLRWCVAEMDRRYRLMASLGVRNLNGYNQKVNEAIKKGEPLPMPGALVTDEETAKMHLEPLPTIVLIADELADMMMVVGKKVEDLIARLAQKARAAGIHLILATQRPSVDVITGLIKANIPTRIAFQVSSRIDSRTILDQQGAEQLLGHGDMLYLPPGAGVPTRVHGAYLSDDEVHRVVAAWRTYGEPSYLEEVTQEASEIAGGDDQGGEQDPLYDQAVRIVTDSRKASISLVQRRLRIGYNRAARMMEDMEAAGVVSTADHSGSREVLAGES